MANGSIVSIQPNGARFSVSVSIPTAALGVINLTIEVDGPIAEAGEQTRQKLYALGVELAHSFEYPSGLQ